MNATSGWMVPLFGTVVALAVVAGILLVRVWPRKPALTAEEEADLAQAPMPTLQKAAWWSLAVGVAALGACAALVTTHGAAVYWDDDDLRLTVTLIFIVGLLVQVSVLMAPAALHSGRGLDERDKAVLARSTMVQSAFVLLTLAGWMISLTERFHDQGAVPVVYLYLIFGSVVLILGIGQAVGVLLGYWMGGSDGQG